MDLSEIYRELRKRYEKEENRLFLEKNLKESQKEKKLSVGWHLNAAKNLILKMDEGEKDPLYRPSCYARLKSAKSIMDEEGWQE